MPDAHATGRRSTNLHHYISWRGRHGGGGVFAIDREADAGLRPHGAKQIRDRRGGALHEVRYAMGFYREQRIRAPLRGEVANLDAPNRTRLTDGQC